jgi:hypothetical protein
MQLTISRYWLLQAWSVQVSDYTFGALLGLPSVDRRGRLYEPRSLEDSGFPRFTRNRSSA